MEDKMGRACSKHMKDKKCIENFGWKTSREETIWKTEAQMGGHYNGS
jgi:hypothetical protein